MSSLNGFWTIVSDLDLLIDSTTQTSEREKKKKINLRVNTPESES